MASLYRPVFRGALLPLFVPVGIHQIVVCNLLVQLLGLLRVHFLDELGGDSSPNASRLDDRITQYQGTGGDNGPFATTAWSRMVEPIPTKA